MENGGVITGAISTQVWSGDPAAHVSIVNWEKRTDLAEEMGRVGVPPAGPGVPRGPSNVVDAPMAKHASTPLGDSRETPESAGGTPTLPKTHRLTFQRDDSVDSPWETCELPVINPALSVGTDVTGARVLVANAKAKKCYTGQNPVNAGFFLTPEEAAAMIKADPHYIACPRMMKRQTFEFVSQQIHADSQLVIFAFADDYSFGILSSGLHWHWFLARCSTMKADFRYTSAAVALRALRREIIAKLGYSLRALYRTLEEPGADPLAFLLKHLRAEELAK